PALGGDDHAVSGAQIEEVAEDGGVGGRFLIVHAAVGEGVGHQYAVGREDGTHVLKEFAGEQVGRNVVDVESVQHHHVVLPAFAVRALDKGAAIIHKQPLPRALPVSEVALGHADNAGIDFDGVDDGVGQDLLQGHRYGSPAQADDQYVSGLGLQKQRTRHHAGVGKHHFVRLIQIEAGLPSVALDFGEVQAPFAVFLYDQHRCEPGGLGMDKAGA